jgi:hypothetical protein
MRRAVFFAALFLFAAGCTEYDFVVRNDNAPLYADESRTTVLARMKRLDTGHIGHSAPKDDPVEVEYLGLEGYANLSDIRVFSYPSGNDRERFWATEFNRREVVLESKDWPPEIKESIRWNRIQNGMTREMVRLAWGAPTSVRPLQPAGEEWLFDVVAYDVYDDVRWYYAGGFSHIYYAYPCGWGFAWYSPYWEPVRTRTYFPRVRHKTVTFNEAGLVTGWNDPA